MSSQKTFTGLFLEKCFRFIRIFSFLNPFYITTAKPKLSKPFFLNAGLFIFQLPYKPQLPLKGYSGLPEQFSRFIRVLGFLGVYKITTAKPRLGIDLSLNVVLFISQLLGNLQPFLIMFNGLPEQFVCLIYILGFFSLFEITMANLRLNPALL